MTKYLRCHTDVVMTSDGKVACTAGMIYPVVSDFTSGLFIRNNQGESHHFANDTDRESSYMRWFTLEEKIDFGVALLLLKQGHKVARAGWNGKGIFIELQRPDEHSCKMTHPYIFIDSTGLQTDNPDAPKNRVPWVPSQTDLMAKDWLAVL